MAPKRGGGGGGGGRSSFRGSSCSDSAFTLTVSIIQLSFAAFWFLVYIGLAVLSGRRKKRILAASHAKEQLQWGMLTAAIVFRIIGVIFHIISMVLSECDPGALASIRLNVAGSWFVSFSVLFLYGVIMIPVCRQLHSVAGQMMAKAVTFVHMGLMVFLGILLLAALAVATSITEQRLSSRYGYSIFALADAQRGLYITYDVFAVIAMGSAAISMVLALSRKVQLRTRSMTSWVILLIIASIGLALFNLASNINTFFFLNIRRASSVYDSFLAQYFLSHFFFAFTFLCVIYVVSNTAIILGYANNQAANRAAPEDAGAIGAVPAVHDGAVPVATPAVHGESKDYYAPTPEMHNVPPYQQVPPQGQPPMQQGQHYPPPPPPQGQPLQQPGQHYPTPPPPQTYY